MQTRVRPASSSSRAPCATFSWPGATRKAGLEVISEDYIQHNTEIGDGRKAVADMLRRDDPRLVNLQIHRLCAQENFVAVLSEAILGDSPYAQGDLFRVDHGMIVEHWNLAEAIAPKEKWANTGKF
ncbi:MAG: hypothetical protein OEV40_31520 [Acidimicrobiia bacterium]|nr:hypothetical protein [Acidimicrobiia bacterium]